MSIAPLSLLGVVVLNKFINRLRIILFKVP